MTDPPRPVPSSASPSAADPNIDCPHCGHFVDWHIGLPFRGGPHGEWRYRCRCDCTVDVHDGVLRLLDRDTLVPA